MTAQPEGSSGSLSSVSTGTIYANAAPHVRSVHAYFPSVVALGDGDLLASYVLGEAFEAVNLRVHRSRLAARGDTWVEERPLAGELDGRPVSESGRLTALRGGEVVALLQRHDRSGRLDRGLTNPATLGFVPTEFALARSADGGRAWSAPAPLAPPVEGPCFELCSPITVLRDGRWLLPTSTWADWDGDWSNGRRMLAFVSEDEGRTWPRHLEVLHAPAREVFFWESKIVELDANTLVVVAWAHDVERGEDLPNQYGISHDGGASWTPPLSTGLRGQTLAACAVGDGRLLCVYRRMDRTGLWAVLARVDGERWESGTTLPLWGGDASGLTGRADSMAENFRVLRFGAPCITPLADGDYLVSFWCYEDCTSVIRWFRLRLA